MSRLEKDVNNHHKHYHGLILWLKAHKGHVLVDLEDPDCEDQTVILGNEFDLCNMFSEGSTVATCLWYRYKDGWGNKQSQYQCTDCGIGEEKPCTVAYHPDEEPPSCCTYGNECEWKLI